MRLPFPRRRGLALLAGLALAIAFWLLSGGSGRPNILLITVCSVRPDHMSLYGYSRQTTPTLAALAADSVVFDDAISPWPKTTPAFAATMTGKYPHTTGVMRVVAHQQLDDGHETLAEILLRAGYDTAAFVSTSALNRQTNLHQGFRKFVETYRLPRSMRETTRRAFNYLVRPRERPFFLWVHYNNAHYPYRAPGAPRDLFVGDEQYDANRRVQRMPKGSLRLDVPAEHPNRRQTLRPDIGGVHPLAVLRERPEEHDFYVARYDAGIFGADRMIGELIDGARRLGLLDDTIVVVVGDHGESLGEHNYFFEHGRFPYDDCARVPLLIRPAGGAPPIRIGAPVAAFSLAPTLLQMVGVDSPREMESRSLVPTIEGQPPPAYVFTQAGYQSDFTIAVRDATWKLVHVPNPLDRALMTGSEYELYHLGDDPGETANRYSEEHEAAARLRSVLEKWAGPWRAVAYRDEARKRQHLDAETAENLGSLGYLQ